VVAWDRSVLDGLLARRCSATWPLHTTAGRAPGWRKTHRRVDRGGDAGGGRAGIGHRGLWQQREALLAQASAASKRDTDTLQQPLQALIGDLCVRLLQRLYPEASAVALG